MLNGCTKFWVPIISIIISIYIAPVHTECSAFRQRFSFKVRTHINEIILLVKFNVWILYFQIKRCLNPVRYIHFIQIIETKFKIFL